MFVRVKSRRRSAAELPDGAPDELPPGSSAGAAPPARCRVFSFVLLFALLLPMAVHAQQEPAESMTPGSEDDTIVYRRWLAPWNQIPKWTLGDRYLPLTFKEWTELLEKASRPRKAVKTPPLSRIELRATLKDLQLVDGRGVLECLDEEPDPDDENSGIGKNRWLPLEPWGLWTAVTTAAAEEDGTESAAILRASDGSLRLRLPDRSDEEEDETSEPDRRSRVRFDWSLRSRSEPGSGLSFDFELPPCLSTELYLDLPVSLVPTCGVGIVTKDSEEKEEGRNENNGERRQRWRILTGRHSRFNVTISSNEPSRTSPLAASALRTMGYTIEPMRYTIAPEGLNVFMTLKFEKAHAKLDELIFEVESPLRIISVQYGEQPVPWTRLGASEDGTGSRVHVNLSGFSDRSTDDLTVSALAPLPQSRPWVLPRLRAVSPNLFWKETRCRLHVLQPFLVRDIGLENAVQVRPRSAPDFSDREVYIFQFFEDDARITVDFEEYSPEITTAGAVQFLWGNNEVRGNMVLECGIAEGDAYTLQFPISPSWTIDSVKSLGWMSETQKTLAGDEVLSWDVLEDREPEPGQTSSSTRWLSIQLKHPIRPKKSLQVSISAHFRADGQKEFRLHDFSPLQLPPGKESSHFIIIQQSNSQYHLQCRTSGALRSNTVDAEKLRTVQRYIEDVSGSVFALNARNREIRFVLERLKPNYSANISGVVSVRDKELRFEFDMQCQPIDSAVDRIYVHFVPELFRKKPVKDGTAEPSTAEPPNEGKDGEPTWDWTGLTESVRPLQVRRLATEELGELFPGPRGPFDDFPPGEIWEIRLSGPQSSLFGLRAVAAVPLPDSVADSIEVPLASLPFASSQRGEISIKSARRFPYRVVNTRLKSIPVAPAKWFRYEETRAAFRYNPREEPRLALQSPLSLERLSSEEMPPSAWVWSLRLDSQYEPDGTVKNNAIFLLENQGKKTLRIRLPEGVDIEDVRAVWMDEQREIWHPEDESPGDRFYTPSQRSPATQAETRLVVVALPEGTRFVTISLEYVGKSKPLVRRRKLQPRYPSVDVPVLSGSWTAWFPPEFEVSLPAQTSPSPSRGPLRLSDAMSYLLSSRHFDPFSRADWERIFQHDKRHREAEFAARSFFDWISSKLRQAEEENDPENAFLRDSHLREGRPIRIGRSADLWREDGKQKWSDLFADEKSLAELLAKLPQDAGKGIDVNILIDRKALALQGIFPHTDVAVLESAPAKRYGDELFEQAGLVLLVSSRIRPDKVRAYTFYVTSPLVLSLHRHFFTESLGPAARYVPETVDLGTPRDAEVKESSVPLPGPIAPLWTPLSRWLADSQPFSFPWSISSQINRLSSVTPHWNAFEMAQKPNNRLYVVHRKTFVAYQWLAFLAVVVLTMRKPFSHPVVLVFLLVLFEILARLVAPCQAGVPSGAFLGALVSLGFCLIRPRAVPMPRLKRRFQSSHTETHTRYDAEKTQQDSDGHIRLPFLLLGAMIVTSLMDGMLCAETLPSRSNDTPTVPAPAASPPAKEAYRIFFPVDENHRMVGNRVYAPVDLLDLLTRSAETVWQEPLHRWSIVKAEYRGSIDSNPVSQKLELGDDFSLLLDVILESESAVISLPPLPLLQDRATWDSKPIQPTWRTQDVDRRQHLVFHIENERKGLHRLRLALAPTKILRDGGVHRIEFDVPRVADATLFMKTPPESPPLAVAESFGAVTPNSAASPEFVARIGPVDKLSLSWPTEPDREEATSVEVEQRFDLLARPTQIEIWTTFVFRINGGRIRHINLLTDPRWRLSGQYRCNEYAVETDENPFHLPGPEGLPAARNQVVQLNFKEPVTGPLTLTAGFVLRDFISGVGKVRLPHFEALNTRIVQSTLAVSADPLLEVDCPETGLQSGYRSGWNSVPAAKPEADGTSAIPATSFEAAPVRDDPSLAEYDLTRTDASWVLGIRTRKSTPTLRLTQSVRFDQGDSALLCQAEFSSDVDIFQQHFSVPESFRIDSVEVRDSQDKIVEVRRSEVDRPTPGSSYCVFFRQPLSGRYSMTIRGGFETQADFSDTAPPSPLRRRIPMPTFENADVEEQTLNLFRTASMMVDVLAEGTGWTVSEVAPVLPESLREAFLCGCWKKSADTVEVDTAAAPPEFSMLPNRPVIRGTQITSLERQASDAWNTTFDFYWNIVDGELDTIRLRWDEQYSVAAVEPTMPFHLETDEGRPILVLTPGSPLSGTRHFRIRSALNHPGTSISVPHIGPEFDERRKYEMKSYVVLPRFDDEERIPWNLAMLEEPDEQTVRQLEEILSSPLGDAVSETPAPVGESEQPLFFQAIAEDFSATISRQSTHSVASLYDVGFVVKDDGVVFGIATVDLRNRGQDSFILQMPIGYELIQVTCSGITSKGTRLPPGDRLQGDRWKVDLWSSDYPQRVRILFRGSLVRPDDPSRPPGVSLPVLKGVFVQKTIWLITFDAVRGKPFAPLDVSTVREKEFGQSSFSSAEILGETVTELGRHVPATGSESVQTLFKFNLLRLYHLRTILDLLSSPSPSRSEEVRRWFSLWSGEWYGLQRLLDDLGRQYPESLMPGKHLFLLDLSGSNLEESGFGAAELYLEANNITQPLQALTFGYKELVSKNFDLDDVEDEVRRSRNLSANSMLYWRDRLTEDAAYLFGASSGQIQEIRLNPVPNTSRFSERLREWLFPWVLIPLLLPLFSRRLPFMEWFCQFPHFWGAVLGVLLWCLFPPGYFGIAVLVLTYLSWMFPLWPKHTEFQEHPPS